MPVIDTRGLIEERSRTLREFHERVGAPRAELDLSGGVDSAVMLGLLARALGPDQITAVYSGIHSSERSRARARDTAQAFQVPLVEIELGDLFDDLVQRMRRALEGAGHDLTVVDARASADGTILGSIRSCLRAPVGRGFNRLTGGGIRHGTGNECEDRWLRFYQKGGDGEVDTNPLANLSKGEVYQLALGLGVPRGVIEATPTPDLQGIGEAHNDEDELFELTGVRWTYSRIDSHTGEYRRLGTIERLSRFLDQPAAAPLLGDDPLDARAWTTLVGAARPFFAGLDEEGLRQLLRSARRIEATTRHKANPNCPALGTRAALVEAGLVTDELPHLPLD